jgi:hypothetical protein
MSMVTIEVEIDHGKVTSGNGTTAFSIGSEADGLPVIRAQGGVITSALVREIEGFTA